MLNTLPSNASQESQKDVYRSALITASVTYSWVFTEKTTIFVSGCGGGGGGGRLAGDGGTGGAGGESYARVPMRIDPAVLPSIAIIIGAGGAGATVDAAAGGIGGVTTFGALLSMAAGVGGSGVATDTPGTDGTPSTVALNVPIDRAEGSGGHKVTGGTGGTGNIVGGADGALGGDGNTTEYRDSMLDNTGIGGSPTGGHEGGGGGGSWGDGGDTAAAPGYGGGGYGGADSSNGQNGAAGFVLIEWYE